MTTPHISEQAHGNVLEMRLSGKLWKEDFETFVPEIDRMIEHFGKIRILVELHDFHGWNPEALWEDVKWEAKHFDDIERLAIVGERIWHRVMASFCTVCTTATVKYFEPQELEEARGWLDERQATGFTGFEHE